MRADENGWMFADAWVLTAVSVSPRPCSLTELVATADVLNHAVLLEAEVTDAVGKLVGSGLLAVTPDLTFSLTPQGAATVERRHGSLFTQIDSVLSLLDSVTPHAQEFTLPAGAMQEAVDAYKARSRRR